MKIFIAIKIGSKNNISLLAPRDTDKLGTWISGFNMENVQKK
jgi:hypothetical protein